MYTLSKSYLFRAQLAVVLLLLLASCMKKPENIQDYNLLDGVYGKGGIPVTYGLPYENPVHTLKIYIEGDGRGWINKRTPSGDPTPSHSLVLRLMQLDVENSLYLSRPCQYYLNENCQQFYWTEGRHAGVLVDAMNAAITELKQTYNAKEIELIGHSGGGTMAMLIASKRSDITRILTVAANLDVEEFARIHKVTPMKGSLNPMDVTDKLKNIPQLHLVGGKDEVVLPKLVQRFIEKINSPCVHYKNYPENGHNAGWENVWRDVLAIDIQCK
tara:strand:- start:36130 stop:36945 length:816 start_codon:yes stop_codon:yes gene_type:complete